MRTNALDGVGSSSLLDLRCDVGFVLAEAVADRPPTDRLLLPDGRRDIGGCETRPVLAEVHNRASFVRTEAVRVVLIASQRGRRQHGLDRVRFDWSTGGPAFAAHGRRTCRGRFWTTAISHGSSINRGAHSRVKQDGEGIADAACADVSLFSFRRPSRARTSSLAG